MTEARVPAPLPREPDAWQYSFGDSWEPVPRGHRPEDYERQGYKVRPLYAAPVDPSGTMPMQRVSKERLAFLHATNCGHGSDGALFCLRREMRDIIDELNEYRRAWPSTLDRVIKIVEKVKKDTADKYRWSGFGSTAAVSIVGEVLAALRAANTGSAER